MAQRGKLDIITLEEHFWDEDLTATFPDERMTRDAKLQERLYGLGELRLREMDEAGIAVQVISHAPPGTQRLPADSAVPLARKANDRLAAAVRQHPDRFAGLASLPTADPKASADELARAVEELGFRGAIIHGLANGEFIDDERFWPIFARAEALDVPIYLHPAMPLPQVTEAYYQKYEADFRNVIRAGWGFTVETATQAIRLILSGVFDRHPGLKIILGHLGETIPFLLWRIEHALERPGQKEIDFRGIFCRNFYVTTSGFFSNPALLCTLMEMGADRILFSIDYPFVPQEPAVRWLEQVPLSPEDKARVASGNARRLLKL